MSSVGSCIPPRTSRVLLILFDTPTGIAAFFVQLRLFGGENDVHAGVPGVTAGKFTLGYCDPGGNGERPRVLRTYVDIANGK